MSLRDVVSSIPLSAVAGPPAPGTGRVIGRVLDAETRRPVGGAVLQFRRVGPPPTEVAAADSPPPQTFHDALVDKMSFDNYLSQMEWDDLRDRIRADWDSGGREGLDLFIREAASRPKWVVSLPVVEKWKRAVGYGLDEKAVNTVWVRSLLEWEVADAFLGEADWDNLKDEIGSVWDKGGLAGIRIFLAGCDDRWDIQESLKARIQARLVATGFIEADLLKGIRTSKSEPPRSMPAGGAAEAEEAADEFSRAGSDFEDGLAEAAEARRSGALEGPRVLDCDALAAEVGRIMGTLEGDFGEAIRELRMSEATIDGEITVHIPFSPISPPVPPRMIIRQARLFSPKRVDEAAVQTFKERVRGILNNAFESEGLQAKDERGCLVAWTIKLPERTRVDGDSE
ncbi:MAG: hypothetical protein HYS22_07595 [Deltaproteobacteria bacterium]|nr:hypothetical protein [Deltaproteobacteria bacterium]